VGRAGVDGGEVRRRDELKKKEGELVQLHELIERTEIYRVLLSHVL